MGGEKAVRKIQICYSACIPEELDDFKMVFLTPFAVCLWNKQVIAVSIVKLEIHQMKKIKGEMRKISNPSCSSFPCHFLFFFTKNILRVNISQQEIPLFTQSAYFGDFPLTFLLFPRIFLCVTLWQRTTQKHSVGVVGMANNSPGAKSSLFLLLYSPWAKNSFYINKWLK